MLLGHQCGRVFSNFLGGFCIIAFVNCWPLLEHRSSVAVSVRRSLPSHLPRFYGGFVLDWITCCLTENDAKSVWQSLWAKEPSLLFSIMAAFF